MALGVLAVTGFYVVNFDPLPSPPPSRWRELASLANANFAREMGLGERVEPQLNSSCFA